MIHVGKKYMLVFPMSLLEKFKNGYRIDDYSGTEYTETEIDLIFKFHGTVVTVKGEDQRNYKCVNDIGLSCSIGKEEKIREQADKLEADFIYLLQEIIEI